MSILSLEVVEVLVDRDCAPIGGDRNYSIGALRARGGKVGESNTARPDRRHVRAEEGSGLTPVRWWICGATELAKVGRDVVGGVKSLCSSIRCLEGRVSTPLTAGALDTSDQKHKFVVVRTSC